jgi:NADH:ubiquinone oxidoreductase subunit E
MMPVHMMPTQTLYLCMGSACHQLGGFRLIPQIEEILQRHGLADRVELRGAFCLEKCELGRSVKFGDRVFTGLTPDNLEERLTREVLPTADPA